MGLSKEERGKADLLIEKVLERNKISIRESDSVGSDETHSGMGVFITYAVMTCWLWIPILLVMTGIWKPF